MRLTRLILKNWGPHEHLDIDMDTPVFGLIGLNGTGKSNIMSAIAFACTGLTEKGFNQADFVRRGKGEDIANGSVDLSFVKGGVKGRIFRQVGKTPKKSLWWDNCKDPITKSADIDRLLSQILDCNRNAIDRVVFLKQRHMVDFLTMTPALREEAFAEMCLVDHLGLVADVASQEILQLQKTVTDLTSQRDEAMLSKEQALAALRTAESELELHPDREPEIKWVSSRIVLVNNHFQAQEKLQVNLAAVNSAKERRALIAPPAFLGETPADTKLELLQTGLGAARSAALAASTLRREKDSVERDTTRLAEVREKAAGALEKAPRLIELQQEVTTLQSQVEIVSRKQAWDEERRVLLATRDAALEPVKKGREAMQTLPDPAVVAQWMVDYRKELDDLAPLRFKLQLASEVEGKVQGCCPLCDSQDLSRLPTGEALKAALEALATNEGRIRAKLTQAETDQRTRIAWQAKLDAYVAALEAAETAVREQPAWDASIALPFEPQELDDKKATIAASQQALEAVRSVVSMLPTYNEEIARLTASLADKQSPAQYDAQILDYDKQATTAAELESQLAELQNFVRSKAAVEKAVETAEANLAQTQKEVEELAVQIGQQFRQKPAEILITDTASIGDLQAAVSELKTKQTQRDQVRGAIVANTDALRRAERRVDEIEERVRRNAATQSVIGYLEDLRNAFSRQGIPRHYLTKVFDAVAESTQDRLAEWDTDFQIEKDIEKLFNFNFYRTDDPDTLLDQKQLSGGQMTRLAMSFTMAIPDLLFPGLEFLSLDEPGEGLDAEGDESLVRVLQKIAASNAQGESQVIVVTHKPALRRAFSKSFTVTRRAGDTQGEDA